MNIAFIRRSDNPRLRPASSEGGGATARFRGMPRSRRAAVIHAAALAGAIAAASLGPTMGRDAIGDGERRAAAGEPRACDAPPSAPAPLDDALAGSIRVRARAGAIDVAYVADEDEPALRVVGAGGDAIGAAVLDGLPSSVVITADGRLAVAIRDRAEIEVLIGSGAPGDPLRVHERIAVPDEPVAMTLTPGRGAILVASARGRTLTALDGRSFARLFERRLDGEPRGVDVSADGSRAFVHRRAGAKLVVDLAPGPLGDAGARRYFSEPRKPLGTSCVPTHAPMSLTSIAILGF